MVTIKTKQIAKGRVVNLSDEGDIYIGQNYKIVQYDRDKNLSLVGKVPCKLKRKLIEPSRLLCRLLRHEIRGFEILSDLTKVAATRLGLYYSEPDSTQFKRAEIAEAGLEVKPPMAMTTDSAGRVLWGEYWGNAERREVRLFASNDSGRSYEPFLTFKAGEVKHIHHILEDKFDDCYWVCAGDENTESGIGRLSKDLKNFDWLIKGNQQCRAVTGFVFKDKIVYGTDTNKDFNAIYAVDKINGNVEKLCETPGSCIYAAKFGKWYAVSTSVEYFEKYENNFATLWISSDAVNWQQVYQSQKDGFSMKYFQFGSIVLPRGNWNQDEIVFSGQALKKIENKVFVAEVVNE